MARHTASVLARARRAGAGRLAKPPALALLALPLLFPFLMLATTARGGDAKLTWQSNLPGEGVEWMSLSNATAEVGAKPILALIHRAGCGACNSLKGSFTNDASDYERFVRLAKDYTMVSVSDDPAANEDKRLSPDGGYVPRAIFLSADGTPHHEVKNEGYNDKYPHFYISVKQIADSMERTLELEWAKPAEKPCGDPTCEGCDLCKDEL